MVSLKTHLNKTSSYVLTEKLWFNSSLGTNYQLWRTHVRHHFQRQELLGFIDGTNPSPPETTISLCNSKLVRNPDYFIWKRIDQSLKEGIFVLLEDDVVDPAEFDIGSTSSRDIWLYLERKFQKYKEQLPTGKISDDAIVISNVEQGQLSRASDEYSELYSAALLGDRVAVRQIFSTIRPDEMNSKHAMALHGAVAAGEKAIEFVKNLGCCMSSDLISVKDAGGNTALSIAAVVGNKAAATVLVDSNSNLLYLPNISGDFPVHVAAKHAKRETLIYLLSVTKDNNSNQNPFDGYYGLALLTSTIESGFYDIALYLVKKYPYLARLKLSANSALKSIVKQKYRDDHVPTPNLFWFPNIDYYSSPLMQAKDIDEANIDSLYISPPGDRSLAETMKRIYKSYFKPLEWLTMIKKLLVIDIVKLLCKEMKDLNSIEVEDICRDGILIAAKLDNHEIIEEILNVFPHVIHSSCPSFLESLIHVAVENRCINVFNIVYRMSDHTHLYLDLLDNKGNNLLHSVAKLAPPHKLSVLSNAAVQMQYEMQWYIRRMYSFFHFHIHRYFLGENHLSHFMSHCIWTEEVEKLIHPHSKEQLNTAGKTPRMIFESEHEKLRDEGEKWVKDTVHMCTITAALISTIMFAAAITVPGDTNSNTGLPFFEKKHAFVVFAVSDAVSLFTSASSLLLFLHISTFRYKEDDFLYSIPEQLVFGLMCLIISIASMMLTFGATLNVVFGGKKLRSLTSMVLMSLLIVAIFGYLLRPLLRDFAKLLNKNQGFLGEPHWAESSSSAVAAAAAGKEYVFERKVASHESV